MLLVTSEENGSDLNCTLNTLSRNVNIRSMGCEHVMDAGAVCPRYIHLSLSSEAITGCTP